MADLDAELLALAGGDDSSADERSPSPKPKSPSPQQHLTQLRSSSPADMGRKGTAKVVKKPRRRRADSDDDGVVYVSPLRAVERVDLTDLSFSSTPSSHHSLQSASMSESDSEGGTPAITDDKPMFPFEKLYLSSKDKDEIESLPEIKREEILADRAAQLERHQQDLALRRLLASREKEEAKATEKKKRKAGAADLEESQRKSSRQRTTLGGRRAGERNDALEAYKKQRAEKGLRDEQRRRDVAARKERHAKGSPGNDFSDVDAEGEDEVEWADKKFKDRTPSPPKDDPIAELTDIQRAKIGRDNFAQVCYNPGFEEAITDCYARICIGPSERNLGQNEYRLARIKGFTTGRPYTVTAPNGRFMPVETYVVAAHGKAERPWTFLECSMGPFTDDEWRRYRITMANDNLKLPTKSFVNNKLSQINKLINHRFTDAEISEKLRRQAVLTAKITREEERAPIEERRLAALAAGDYETAERCEEELRDIVPMKLALNTTLYKKVSTYVNKEQERLAELNRRNQRLNSENVRKAQVAEMRAKKKHNQRLKGIDDLFGDGSDISRSGTPVNGISTPLKRAGTPLNGAPVNGTSSPANGGTPRAGTPLNGTPAPQQQQLFKPVTKGKTGVPVIKKALLEDEVIKQKVLDLGIDLEL
jgi:RNA polymerase-associated protein RTF1